MHDYPTCFPQDRIRCRIGSPCSPSLSGLGGRRVRDQSSRQGRHDCREMDKMVKWGAEVDPQDRDVVGVCPPPNSWNPILPLFSFRMISDTRKPRKTALSQQK